MTISGVQAYSYSAFSMQMQIRVATSGVQAPAGTAADTATLSSASSGDASTAAPTTATPGSPAAASDTAATPRLSRAERRAEALFTALDADEDGTVTETEFTEGALTLLRNAGSRQRIDDDSERGERRLARLERKLEKVFDRVDKNDDGAIDQDELTAALSRSRGHRRHRHDHDAPAPASDGGTTGATAQVTFVSVTFVSVAMQRYGAVAQAGAPAAGATSGEPAAAA